MIVLRLALFAVLVASPGRSQENSHQALSAPRVVPPASCPVTARPEHPFIPPASYKLGPSAFWYGSEKLWTFRPKQGAVWTSEPRKPGHEHESQPLTAKLFWMSINYDPKTEPYPNLTVTGKRLDGPAAGLLTTPARGAFTDPAASAISIGVYVPTPGCWEITGEYKGEKLSFVVWVVEAEKGSDR